MSSEKKVTVEVSADASPFAAGLARVENALDSFTHHAEEQFSELGRELLGAFAFGAIVEKTKELVSEFRQVAIEAQKFGVSSESVQRFGQVAEEAGLETDVLLKTLSKATRSAFEAATGNKELADSFRSLGIDAAEFTNQAPEEQLIELAERFKQSGYSAQFQAEAFKVLGKTGQEIFPLLAKGPEELREALGRVKVASEDTVDTLAELAERSNDIWDRVKVGGAEALNFLVEKVEWFGAAMAGTWAVLSNLPNGLSQAIDEGENVMVTFTLDQEKKRKELEEKSHNRKRTDTEGIAEGKEKVKAAEEEDKILERIDEKLRAQQLRNKDLKEQREQLFEEEQKADIQATIGKDRKTRLEGLEKELDIGKELDEVNKKIAEGEEKAQKEADEKAKKEALQSLREQIEQKKEAMKDAEEKVRDLSKDKSFKFDSLAEIGGGIRGANYNTAGRSDIQRQHLDVAKQQLDLLRKQLAVMQRNENAIQQYDGSWSFDG